MGLILLLLIPLALLALLAVLMIGTFFLRWATSLVCKFKMKYWTAFKIYLVEFVVVIICSLVMQMGAGLPILPTSDAAANEPSVAYILLSTLMSVLVAAAIYGHMITHPETGTIGFKKGFFISLVSTLLFIGVVAVFAFIGGIIAVVANISPT